MTTSPPSRRNATTCTKSVWPCSASHWTAVRNVPEPGASIFARRGEGPAIGTESGIPDDSLVREIRQDQRARPGVPELDDAVEPAAGQPFTVGTRSNRVHPTLVTAERMQLSLRIESQTSTTFHPVIASRRPSGR